MRPAQSRARRVQACIAAIPDGHLSTGTTSGIPNQAV